MTANRIKLAKLARQVTKCRSDDSEAEAVQDGRTKLQDSIDEFFRLFRRYIRCVYHNPLILADLSDEWEDYGSDQPQSFDDEDEDDDLEQVTSPR